MLTVSRRALLRTSIAILLLPFAELIIDCSTPSTFSYTFTPSQMAASIPKQLAAAGITSGLSIALVDDQKVVWVQSFGYSDVASGTLATPNTVYRIASISKTFSTAMIMQLYEQGKVGLDDPLTKYIPTFSIKPPLGFPSGGPVTIRTMLTHQRHHRRDFQWVYNSDARPQLQRRTRHLSPGRVPAISDRLFLCLFQYCGFSAWFGG